MVVVGCVGGCSSVGDGLIFFFLAVGCVYNIEVVASGVVVEVDVAS